jgi:hypothetical protein
VVDLLALLKLVQQTVLVLGQSNVLMNFDRRHQLLARFLPDNKKASAVLKSNEQLLRENKTYLFGTKFYNTLYRKAKGSKLRKEIMFQLGTMEKRARAEATGHTTKEAILVCSLYSISACSWVLTLCCRGHHI